MNEKVTRSDLKRQAKAKMRGDFGTAFKLNSIPIIFMVIAAAAWLIAIISIIAFASLRFGSDVSSATSAQEYLKQASSDSSNTSMIGPLIGGIISGILNAGIAIGSLTWLRLPQDETLAQPFRKQFQGFTSDYFVGLLVLYLIVTALASIGLAVLVIPAIVVLLAFQPIYMLYSDEGDKYSIFGLVGRCWRLMRGHKFDLFVFQLSFIFWYIGVLLTGGLLGIYFLPYHNLALAAFYDNVRQQEKADAAVAA